MRVTIGTTYDVRVVYRGRDTDGDYIHDVVVDLENGPMTIGHVYTRGAGTGLRQQVLARPLVASPAYAGTAREIYYRTFPAQVSAVLLRRHRERAAEALVRFFHDNPRLYRSA